MRVKTDENRRFSYFTGFAARGPAAAGQFRPVARGGTSFFLREAKPVKLKKVAFSHFFDTLMGPSFDGPFCMLFLFLFSGCRLSVKWQSHFTEGFRVLPLAFAPGRQNP